MFEMPLVAESQKYTAQALNSVCLGAIPAKLVLKVQFFINSTIRILDFKLAGSLFPPMQPNSNSNITIPQKHSRDVY